MLEKTRAPCCCEWANNIICVFCNFLNICLWVVQKCSHKYSTFLKGGGVCYISSYCPFLFLVPWGLFFIWCAGEGGIILYIIPSAVKKGYECGYIGSLSLRVCWGPGIKWSFVLLWELDGGGAISETLLQIEQLCAWTTVGRAWHHCCPCQI